MNLSEYLNIIREEINSGKVRIRRDTHTDYQTLESLLRKAQESLGQESFESEVINPLADLAPYLKNHFSPTVDVMKYFAHLKPETAKSYAKKVRMVLDEKLTIAQQNSQIIPGYKFEVDSLRSSLYDAYSEALHENRRPSSGELKTLRDYLDRD